MLRFPGKKMVKIAIALVPVFVFFWLAARYTAVLGEVTYSYDFSNNGTAIQKWGPNGRAVDREKNLRTGDSYQRILGQPVYLPVEVPRSYDSADVTIEYANEEQSLVEVGVVTSEEPFAVRLQPFEQKTIDRALDTWPSILEQDDGLVLLQKEEVFTNINDFMEQPPIDAHVGIYNTELPVQYSDESYMAQTGGIVIDRLLRGPHKFSTYVKNETLHVEFDLVDVNRQFNEDSTSVKVYSQGTLVQEKDIEDDGIVDAVGESSEQQTITIDIPGLDPGAYDIHVGGTSDIVITQIRSDQEQFVAIGNVFIINNEEYTDAFDNIDLSQTELYTNATQLMARTERTTGIQTLTIDTDTLDVTETKTPFWWFAQSPVDDRAVRTLTLPKNAVAIESNGFIAFASESLFDPNYFIEVMNETTTVEQLDYILYRDYTSPEQLTGRKVQTATVSLDGVAGDRKSLQFVLSAPGLDRDQHQMRIDSVRLTFKRASIFDKLFNR